jgi:ATP-dependent Clp protease ATP-binding subunit ClpB
MTQKFDQVVIGAIDIAQTEALKRRNNELSPAHLVWGFAFNPQAASSQSLQPQVDLLEQALSKSAKLQGEISIDQIRMGSKLSQWITQASAHATKSGRSQVTESDLLQYIHEYLPQIKLEDIPREGTQGLKQPAFLINLNDTAKAGKLDPVIGRATEIRSVMEILGRRTKNNPVLVGPAGVGKTAIVEGLADQIVKGKVPDTLLGKEVYSLDMGSLMAGTKYRGDFEERIQELLKFVKAKSGSAILFIDELHQLVGAGRTDGAMDAANLLKPALARGDLHCIGATTPEEYQKYILGDAALERRFRSVPVNAPSKEDAIEILMGIRDKLEIHHGIKISEDAIYASVVLSEQYIPEKNLPDKAIDLIDEAASALKLSAKAMPAELIQVEAELRSKKILSQVEKDNQEILEDIKNLEKDYKERKKNWETEVEALQKAQSMQNQLDKLRFDLESAERKGDYAMASQIKYALIPEIEGHLQKFHHAWILDRQHVARVIARQKGIPIEKILKDKQDKILHLEEHLRQRVFGQSEALHEIAEVLVTSFAGLADESRPMGSFLLKGPTGVGKTETAKALSEFLFDNESSLVRLDLSEYSEKHSVAKLIGAPAGYVGYDEGGILTEAIRRKPFAVVLFDEIEKAHPDFADILLQILDDGRLTDNKGRTIDFRNTIVLLTTNSKNIQQDFKPEVLGRLDGILSYAALDQSIMAKLIEKQLSLLNERLKGKKIRIHLHESLNQTLIEQGYDPQFGARPLASVFNRLVMRPLSKQLVSGDLVEGDYRLSWKDQQTQVTRGT